MSLDGALVTILMPCKDPRASFFREALGSVLAQTSPAWRLLVVDDHSTSFDTLAVLRELRGLLDLRIRVLESGGRLITGALNTGMRQATTPYVCTLHCDDLLDRKAVEVLNEHIRRYPHTDYFHSARVYIDGDGHPLSGVRLPVESFTLSDFKHRGLVKPLHCWRVRAARAVGGMDESLGLHGADDYDFPWRMAEADSSFRSIPDCLYYYRDHREHVRLTIHVPLDVQVNELTRIWRKHGLTDREISREIDRRADGYLKQALYSSYADKVDKQRQGYDVRTGWREQF